ncbi:MAG: tyrosine-type recombinase/integrase [Actinobacteria bacterium]|nr:tyrosine-type recombinase/integrase [Actinomycetota bacterium]
MTDRQPPTNKGRKFPAEPLTAAEVKSLLALLSTRATSGVRDRALIGVLFGSGLRLAEALALMPRDVDTSKCEVLVRRGKGGKSRRVPLDAEACAMVDLWLERRAHLELTGRQPLFCTFSTNSFGKALTQRVVRTKLARLGERAGIEKRVHPHGLRHSLASAMADNGVPLPVITAQLGHTSTATTDTYLRKLTTKDIAGHMTRLNLLGDRTE